MILQQLQMQRPQKARRLTQNRDDPRRRLHRSNRSRRCMRPEIRRRSLTEQLIRAGSVEQREIVFERTGQTPRYSAALSCKEVRRLLRWHVDAGLATKHFVQCGGPTLGIADYEKVRYAPAGDMRDRWLNVHGCQPGVTLSYPHSLTRSRPRYSLSASTSPLKRRRNSSISCSSGGRGSP